MSNINNEALFTVHGLVAVITGGGSGLGRMMAHALASNGAAKVYVMGRRMDKLQQTADGYPNIVPLEGDATDKDSLKAVADHIKAEVGYVNLVICNSGTSGPGVNLQQDPSSPGALLVLQSRQSQQGLGRQQHWRVLHDGCFPGDARRG